MYHTYIIYWYTEYHPSFGARILRIVLGIRLGCHLLSHNMYYVYARNVDSVGDIERKH